MALEIRPPDPERAKQILKSIADFLERKGVNIKEEVELLIRHGESLLKGSEACEREAVMYGLSDVALMAYDIARKIKEASLRGKLSYDEKDILTDEIYFLSSSFQREAMRNLERYCGCRFK